MQTYLSVTSAFSYFTYFG